VAKGILYGEDKTSQFAVGLDSACREFGVIASGDPAGLAGRAAAWFREQMLRPIELREWLRSSYRFSRYHLVDTGRALSWSSSNNRLLEFPGPPTRILPVVMLLARPEPG